MVDFASVVTFKIWLHHVISWWYMIDTKNFSALMPGPFKRGHVFDSKTIFHGSVTLPNLVTPGQTVWV